MAIDQLLMRSASSALQELDVSPEGAASQQNQRNPANDELLQMVLASIMDPEIDANDVGSKLMQQITLDTLGPNETTAGTPEGLRDLLSAILQDLFAANAETSKPRSR